MRRVKLSTPSLYFLSSLYPEPDLLLTFYISATWQLAPDASLPYSCRESMQKYDLMASFRLYLLFSSRASILLLRFSPISAGTKAAGISMGPAGAAPGPRMCVDSPLPKKRKDGREGGKSKSRTEMDLPLKIDRSLHIPLFRGPCHQLPNTSEWPLRKASKLDWEVKS